MTIKNRVAEAIRAVDPCGCSNVAGEHVFCDDLSLDGLDDGHGKPIRQKVCTCKLYAQAALNAIASGLEWDGNHLCFNGMVLSTDVYMSGNFWHYRFLDSYSENGQPTEAEARVALMSAARKWLGVE